MIISAPLLASAAELGWWALRRRRRYRVVGTSMEPTLSAGEFVLVDPSSTPAVDDLAMVAHPDNDALLVVKRVVERSVDGRFVLSSDHPDGTDSRHWGPVDPSRLRGRVTMILGRERRLRR